MGLFRKLFRKKPEGNDAARPDVERTGPPPATQGPPAVEASVPTPSPWEWALEHVRFFRPLGFYGGRGDVLGEKMDFSGMTDEAIAERQVAAWPDLGVPRRSGIPSDMIALWADKDRIWHADLECDALEGNEVYVAAVGQWAGISRGAFHPESITERWEPCDDPDIQSSVTEYVTIRLVADRVAHEWRIPHRSDWLTLGLLSHVNGVISPTGLQYYSWDTGDQNACTLVLTKEERGKIENGRGIRLRLIDSDEI